MYITLQISSTNWTFQLKDEAGTDIGSALVYSQTDYRLERNTEMQSYLIFDATRKDNAFPPYAGFPYSRVVILP